MSKHKWANEIIAWANGTQIEELAPTSGRWMLVFNPSWAGPNSFRIHDPYRELKEAKERGDAVQCKSESGKWHDEDAREPWSFDSPPENYRIKPREPLVRWLAVHQHGLSRFAYTTEEKEGPVCNLSAPLRWIKMVEVQE